MEDRSERRARFPGLKLGKRDRRELRKRERGKLSARTWLRIKALWLLDKGQGIGEVARALGTYPRVIRRVGWRYLEGGIDAALRDDERPKPSKMLDAAQQSAVVAMVCAPPPPGRARWTVELIAKAAVEKGIVARVGRETVRQTLKNHDLKPWREKMWCVPRLDAEYVERMEDVLGLYAKPLRPQEPVVCLDERPVVLRESARAGQRPRPGYPDEPPRGSRAPTRARRRLSGGHPAEGSRALREPARARRRASSGRLARVDYEYIRRGTANIFCIVEPKAGVHLTYATRNRTARQFAFALRRVARRYPKAKRIHLVMDNLNTHREKSLTDAFGKKRGQRLWRRFRVHYTPKHGSWLNQAELEASAWSRQCLGRLRVAALPELSQRTRYWTRAANRARRSIHWHFRTDDARRVFRYKRVVTPRSEH